CKKSFKYSSNLTEHMKVHTGERPFLCKKCGKTFRRRSALGQHMR
ncbi:unnamed protein product, partial [Tetraodon nigroviridis]